MYGYGMLMSSKKSETIISPPKIIIQCTHFKLSGIISFYFQLGQLARHLRYSSAPLVYIYVGMYVWIVRMLFKCALF